MSLIRAPLEPDDSATQHNWFAPLAMFIAWLVRIFDQITKLKSVRRTTKFKPNWRDHWSNLRQLEWLRDQILADCARRLLAGETLDAESDFTPSTEPPADYGGPCPATPFEMNRRFLAIARFNADPEAAILEHVRRIAKCEGIDPRDPLRHATASRATSPGYAGGGKAPAPLASLSRHATGGGGMRASRAHDGGGLAFCARGPPCPIQKTEPPPPRRPHLRDRTPMSAPG